MTGRRGAVPSAVRAGLTRLAWLGAAALIALGAGGIVAATDHQPGTAARPELTSVGDAEAGLALATADSTLTALEAEVERLGSMGRLALTALAANDAAELDRAIADGTASLAAIEGLTSRLAAELDGVPYIGGPEEAIRLSTATRDRYDRMLEAFELTDGLGGEWRILTQGALDANRLATLLGEHDRLAGEAAREGSQERYEPALERLDAADEALAEITELHERLARSVDVSTLGRWIDRTRDYDEALRALYEALVESGGRPNDEVRAAFLAEQTARERLPGDTRALVVIMSEVAQGGINQAVIAIETARGGLSATR